LAYRINCEGKSLVYGTDYEFSSVDSREAGDFVDFIKNADVFISDTQYTYLEGAAKEGWGHSTALGAIDLAVRAGVKKLYMFHHDPGHTDANLFEVLEKSRAYYQMMSGGGDMAVELSREGLTVEL
jgi:ribonuclease BN (tRNA processing enzyme)